MINKYIILLFCLVLSSCGTIIRENIDKSKYFYANEDYCSVLDNVCNDSNNYNNLDSLVASDTLFQNDNFAMAEKVLNKTNEKLKERDSAIDTIGNEISSALVNDYVNDYSPFQMDGLFISEYQILNYMAMGDFKSARIAINNGYIRQQKATEIFHKLLDERRKDDLLNNSNLNSDEKNAFYSYLSQINSEYANLDKWKIYNDIVSPGLTYISGLYFLNESDNLSDLENALTYFKRCAGMSPNSKTIQNDLNNTMNLINGKSDSSKQAWVIIESGFAPSLYEEKINLPSFIFSRHITTIPFAFAVAKFSDDIGKNIKISSGTNTTKAEEITDINKMFMTEFSEYSNIAIARALINTITKIGIQYAAREASKQMGKGGVLLELGAMVYSYGTNSADIRSWYTLPNKVRIASVKKDSNGLIKIIQNDKVIGTIQTNPNTNSLIYIRQGTINNIGKPKLIEFSTKGVKQ